MTDRGFPRDLIMQPTFRRRSLRWLLICGAAATATVVGLVVVPSNGSGQKGLSSAVGAAPSHEASSVPAATPSPRRTGALPTGMTTLVKGSQVSNGVELGFPHSTVGAISSAASLLSEMLSLDPSRARVVAGLTADSAHPTAIEDAAAQGAESLRKYLGIPATGSVPAGYSVGFQAVEYQLRDITPDEVLVILLTDVTFTQPKAVHSRVGVYPFLMHWEHGDWKDAGDTNPAYVNLIAVPYTTKAAARGWIPLLP
jgi:hypothetical protein